MLYDLILKSKASFLDRMFTYKSKEVIKPGIRVVVPFGRGNEKTIAIVIKENDTNEEDLEYEAKEIIEILDNKPILNKELIDIAFYMVKNNISDYSSAINTVLPPGSIDSVEEYYLINEKNKDGIKTIDKQLLDFLKEGKSYFDIENKFNRKYKRSYINELVNKNILLSNFEFNKKASIKTEDFIKLNNIEINIPKNAIKQKAIIGYLKNNGITSKKKLLLETNSSNQSLNKLIDKNIVDVITKNIYRDVLEKDKVYKKHELNQEQKEVFNKITEIEDNNFLIHGVTGSGKTEIYLQLVEKYINMGKEAIILVPEISLTPQTIDRFQGRFGKNIAVLHSKLSISERFDQWRLIKNKKVKIVVGARSAIFAPFENLGIIVIDEEHESSYKSEKNPKYSAIEIAKFRSKYKDAKLVLGSATPSVKTMSDVIDNKINYLRLNKRVNNIKMPQIDIVDMRIELKSNNFTMFSNLLKNEIEKALINNKQTILFLNKRGHTSFVFCRSCGYVHKCEACDVAMTYHKSKNRLICHYCGRTALKTNKCKNCGSPWIKEYGAGTEMLEEETKKIFPNARVYRMDADTTTKKSDYKKVYDLMHDNKIDILIGTQMLAKGLDFPNVSLVGLVSADISLNVPDFRAGEKTYNLITQVSGRAGRKDGEGRVIIQTYNPENYAIKYAALNDYKSYFKEELDIRNKFNYPPIINILSINLSSLDRSYGYNYGQKLMLKVNSILRKEKINVVEMSGPTPSVIEKINNRYRFDIIVKSSKKEDLLKIANELRKLKYDNKVYTNYILEEE